MEGIFRPKAGVDERHSWVMSADNWTICPKCERVATEQNSIAQQKLDDDYGKIIREEWEARQKSVAKLLSTGLRDTLSEDFSIGMRGSDFVFRYRAYCIECSFDYACNGKEHALSD